MVIMTRYATLERAFIAPGISSEIAHDLSVVRFIQRVDHPSTTGI